MPTNPNMVAIQTVTVGAGGAASIDFTSIPQTYTDLVVRLSARGTDSGTGANDGRLTFNNSSSGYSSRLLYGIGTGLGSASNSGTYMYWVGGAVAGGHTANTFSNSEIYIPNYTSSNNKSVSFDGVTESNSSYGGQLLTAGLWSNSAAITSLKLTLDYNNFAQYSTATLYGVTSAGYGAKATGGIITQDNNYFYHTFVASGTFTPTSNITADYLVVAGGGGGGFQRGGGGGAGGLRCTVGATGGGGALESALSLTASTNYTVTIGAGGAGGIDTNTQNGSNGSNSVFSSITATGGGYGAGLKTNGTQAAGATGGSGGGGVTDGTSGTVTAAGGAGTANQGYAGGTSSTSPNFPAGGGGGAGAVGANATTTTGGNGGNGVATSISGTSVTYAGGGGGGTYNGGTAGNGGTGGGANAGEASTGTNRAGGTGTANTGGGGGGGNATNGGGGAGGAGGSGIVIVRYAK